MLEGVILLEVAYLQSRGSLPLLVRNSLTTKLYGSRNASLDASVPRCGGYEVQMMEVGPPLSKELIDNGWFNYYAKFD